ncbi:MSHA biogenesis protein MshO [Rubrivivax sp. A210]|uniref:PulJ/GspJ family protein n=1 Tax=Rubrivivax sp. A210 TaxID=2772301 RepID=UPI0019185B66|nr:type II secretion system protein [Rubrivivax sp. A210]CAD5370279.1 MSHA biogenesis protein MshO [Rubrivivax sp. A210]
MNCGRTRAQAGFTLVEAVMVIAITGTLAVVVAQFIVRPVQAYLATSARAALVDQADLALRHIGRDLRVALPGSVRVNAGGTALELIPTSGAARYATAGGGALQFGVLDTAFDLIGPPLTLSSAQELVFYNLGPAVVGADAYAANVSAGEQATSNRRTTTNTAGEASSITIASLAALPALAQAWPYRVTAVEMPVSYRCDLGAGLLSRHQYYGFLATQPDPPAAGTSAVLASGVSGCRFSVDATLVAAHAALVTLRLALSTSTSAGSETVSLYHAVHVDNLP